MTDESGSVASSLNYVDKIAKVCHNANRAYCQTLGDYSQDPWEAAPEWQRATVRNGVEFHMDGKETSPQASHENWMRVKLEEGWVYGPVKDAELKTHPCMVAYDQLPEEQRKKDSLFKAIVDTLK